MTTARRPAREVFGLLLLDKPGGVSSNGALQRAKRLFAAAKAGHAGNLDPLATGMLPILFGSATRLAAFMLEAGKTYRVTAELGSATTTGDAEGETTEVRLHARPLERAVIETAVGRFVGDIEQVPPMYSALKRGGVPLYRLARAGVEVDRRPRRVRVESCTIERYVWPALELRVHCSKGTYVRTLIEDIARAAGTVGHVTALRRLTVTPFQEEAMRTFEQLEAAAAGGMASLDRLLLPAETGLHDWPSAHLGPAEAAGLAHGQEVAADPALPCGHVKVYADAGRLIAIGVVTADRRLRPKRVLIR